MKIPGNPKINRYKAQSKSALWRDSSTKRPSSRRRYTEQGNVTFFTKDSDNNLKFYSDEYGCRILGKVRHYASHSCISGTKTRVELIPQTENCYMVKQ